MANLINDGSYVVNLTDLSDWNSVIINSVENNAIPIVEGKNYKLSIMPQAGVTKVPLFHSTKASAFESLATDLENKYNISSFDIMASLDSVSSVEIEIPSNDKSVNLTSMTSYSLGNPTETFNSTPANVYVVGSGSSFYLVKYYPYSMGGNYCSFGRDLTLYPETPPTPPVPEGKKIYFSNDPEFISKVKNFTITINKNNVLQSPTEFIKNIDGERPYAIIDGGDKITIGAEYTGTVMAVGAPFVNSGSISSDFMVSGIESIVVSCNDSKYVTTTIKCDQSTDNAVIYSNSGQIGFGGVITLDINAPLDYGEQTFNANDIRFGVINGDTSYIAMYTLNGMTTVNKWANQIVN